MLGGSSTGGPTHTHHLPGHSHHGPTAVSRATEDPAAAQQRRVLRRRAWLISGRAIEATARPHFRSAGGPATVAVLHWEPPSVPRCAAPSHAFTGGGDPRVPQPPPDGAGRRRSAFSPQPISLGSIRTARARGCGRQGGPGAPARRGAP
eukprot:365946-Chlamydomonas_euryale.AAC.14